MQPSQLAKSYKSASISTASPGTIILMLMDNALVSMTNALDGFELDHPVLRNEQIHNNLDKAQQVVSVLQAALDLGVEGGFPQQMFALYDFMLEELGRANSRKIPEPIISVKGMLQDIRDAWSEMLVQQMAGV